MAYEILIMPGVAIGGGNPFLDPGAYRGPMIFQLAEWRITRFRTFTTICFST